jgi:hypothetical protein
MNVAELVCQRGLEMKRSALILFWRQAILALYRYLSFTKL